MIKQHHLPNSICISNYKTILHECHLMYTHNYVLSFFRHKCVILYKERCASDLHAYDDQDVELCGEERETHELMARYEKLKDVSHSEISLDLPN